MTSSQGWLLGIHTTTPSLGLALLDLSDQSCRSQSWWLARSLAGQLHVHLEAFLPPQQWSDLIAIGVAKGPGSFTGSRLGVTVARTLGQTLGIPVFGISALAAVAYAYHQQHPEDPPPDLWVEMDAQRGDWIVGQYGFDPHSGYLITLTTEQLWSASAWAEHRAGSIHCVAEADFQDPPPVEAVAQLAAQQRQGSQESPWYAVEPFYGRQPPIHS